jgi:hypothetical protein
MTMTVGGGEALVAGVTLTVSAQPLTQQPLAQQRGERQTRDERKGGH